MSLRACRLGEDLVWDDMEDIEWMDLLECEVSSVFRALECDDLVGDDGWGISTTLPSIWIIRWYDCCLRGLRGFRVSRNSSP